jgi:hypothetical protein
MAKNIKCYTNLICSEEAVLIYTVGGPMGPLSLNLAPCV